MLFTLAACDSGTWTRDEVAATLAVLVVGIVFGGLGVLLWNADDNGRRVLSVYCWLIAAIALAVGVVIAIGNLT